MNRFRREKLTVDAVNQTLTGTQEFSVREWRKRTRAYYRLTTDSFLSSLHHLTVLSTRGHSMTSEPNASKFVSRFFRSLAKLSDAQKRNVLAYWTGRSALPIGGFTDLGPLSQGSPSQGPISRPTPAATLSSCPLHSTNKYSTPYSFAWPTLRSRQLYSFLVFYHTFAFVNFIHPESPEIDRVLYIFPDFVPHKVCVKELVERREKEFSGIGKNEVYVVCVVGVSIRVQRPSASWILGVERHPHSRNVYAVDRESEMALRAGGNTAKREYSVPSVERGPDRLRSPAVQSLGSRPARKRVGNFVLSSGEVSGQISDLSGPGEPRSIYG